MVLPCDLQSRIVLPYAILVRTELPRNILGIYRIASMIFLLFHQNPLIVFLRRHYVHTYFMGMIRVIAINPINFQFALTEPVIPYPNIEINIYHKTPTEQLQAPK